MYLRLDRPGRRDGDHEKGAGVPSTALRLERGIHRNMTNGDLGWITNYIWGIADDVLRDVYVRGKYRDVILPMTVLRRLDAVLEPTKQAVLDMKDALDEMGIADQRVALREAAEPTVLQHVEVHPARPAGPGQPAAAQGRLRGLPGRILAQCAGHPRELRVPESDSEALQGRCAWVR